MSRAATSVAMAAGLSMAAVVGVGALAISTSAGATAARVQRRVYGREPHRGEVPTWFVTACSTFGLKDPVPAWPVASGAAVGAALVVAVSGNLAVFLVVAVVVITAFGMSLRRRRTAPGPNPVDLIEPFTARLVAGAAPAPALASVLAEHDDLDAHLRTLRNALLDGAPFQRALDDWAGTTERHDARLLTDALSVAMATGGSTTAALVRVGDTMRERAALDREVVALSSQARLSAKLLTVVPVAFAALVIAIDPGVRSVVLATPLGAACGAGGLLLDAIGWAWMRRMVEAVR